MKLHALSNRFWLLFILALATFSVQANESKRFIVQFSQITPEVLAQVKSLGGTVTHTYKNINAIAVELADANPASLKSIAGLTSIAKDRSLSIPAPIRSATASLPDALGVVPASAMPVALPDDYLFTHGLTGALNLQVSGIDGSGVVVAVIDSGTANNPDVVPSIAGSVIGGENFVADDPESATSTNNGEHGTWVGSTIAGHAEFLFGMDSGLVQAMLKYAPNSLVPDFMPDVFGPGVALVPLYGSAPAASLYAMKVFSSAGGGSPESRIIAAMDRAITLRKNYDDGMPSVPVSGTGTEDDPYVYDSLNIQVVNMSLGGPTLFAGGDLEDKMTEAMLDAGIVVVVSAGNAGFASMTIGSPGSGKGSLTVGAVNTAKHERILRDLQYGAGIGEVYRPTDHTQMAYFSSRGPNADGRNDPDVVSAGFAVLAQSPTGGINLVSGTSFSAPDVAGGVALLRQARPEASAEQIRAALIETANPMVLEQTADALDQGFGLVDYPAALAALDDIASDDDEDHHHSDHKKASKEVAKNVKRLGYHVLKAKQPWTRQLETLEPGEVDHFFVLAKPDTSQITVTLSDLDLGPADQQNQLFGNDLYLRVQDAVTSTDVTLVESFVAGDAQFVIDNPQSGLIRVAVMGDWTNAASVTGTISIEATKTREGKSNAKGKIAEGAFDAYTTNVPGGTSELDVELSWKENWGYFPTDDLDLILLSPSGEAIYDGATLDSPEAVSITDPQAGIWTILVNGFTVHADLKDMQHGDDDDSEQEHATKTPVSKWQLNVKADDLSLPLN